MPEIDELLFDLNSDVQETRARAVTGLGKIEDARALKMLEELCHDSDVSIRYLARKSLSQQKARQGGTITKVSRRPRVSVEEIRQALSDLRSDQEHVRMRAMKRLEDAAITPEQAVDVAMALAEMIAVEKDGNVLARLLKLLGQYGTFDDARVIIDRLNSQDMRVVANAIEALGNFKSPELEGILLPFLDHVDNRVRANTALVMWNYNQQASLETLEEMIHSTKPYYVDSAVHALVTIPSNDATRILLDALRLELSSQAYSKISARFANERERIDVKKLEALAVLADGKAKDEIRKIISFLTSTSQDAGERSLNEALTRNQVLAIVAVFVVLAFGAYSYVFFFQGGPGHGMVAAPKDVTGEGDGWRLISGDVVNYFPLSLGSYWVYTDGKVYTVIGSETFEGQFHTTAISSTGKDGFTTIDYYTRTQDRLIYYGRRVLPPGAGQGALDVSKLPLLALPVKDGDEKNIIFDRGSVKIRTRKLGTVEVPAGRFSNCVEVESLYTYPKEEKKVVMVFAPDIGMIRCDRGDLVDYRVY